MQKKLKAFTLLELLIGMIISSLVVGFSYWAYFVIYSQYMNYKLVKEQINAEITFQTVILNDVTGAQAIFSDADNEITLQNDSVAEINYRFTVKFILRKQNEIIDTFAFPATAWQVVTIPETSNNLVESFSFNSTIFNEVKEFSFAKQYAADVLINNDVTQGNSK